jgi:hypothetical protein
MALGDFNQDGSVDLAISADSFQVQLYSGNGDGTFSGPQLQRDSTSGDVASPMVGDFNRDGALDIAVTQQVRVNNLTTSRTSTAIECSTWCSRTSIGRFSASSRRCRVSCRRRRESRPISSPLAAKGWDHAIKVSAGIVSDYSGTTTCGSTLAPRATCTMSITLAPSKALNTRNAIIEIQFNQATGPQSMEVTGSGSN